MIISASRRTDIPTVYSEWFYNRVKEGFVLVPNPMNIHMISKVSLSPEVIDGIVFWTKNPIPMMDRLSELDKYKGRYYFTFTINSYGKDAEPHLPSKKDELIPAFIELSKRLGKHRVCWRYDPIFLSDKYNIDYHVQKFEYLASRLGPFTEKCTVSFIDMYTRTQRNTRELNSRAPSAEEELQILKLLVTIAERNGIYIDTCSERRDFSEIGVQHAHCIDKDRLERIGGYSLDVGKDKNQRLECGCFSSIDIGSYNTCRNGCLYCYANFNSELVERNCAMHNPESPLLYGEVGPDDIIKERDMKSQIIMPGLFDLK